MVALLNQIRIGCKTQVPFPTVLCFCFLNKYLSLIHVPIPKCYTAAPLKLSKTPEVGPHIMSHIEMF